jgi:hypothetical protein
MEKTLRIHLNEEREAIIKLLKTFTCVEQYGNPCPNCTQLNEGIKAILKKSESPDTPIG